ncbi:MAG: aminotransferase class III-fold pyridoxal phosphate-dependent enzyme, partial [Bradyrhizobium sp.]
MELPRAVAGEGVYILDAEGKRYLDASGGAAVSCLGHSHQATVRAIQTQITSLPFAHTGFFTNEPMEELAAILTDAAPGDLRKAYFVSGGSEGVEAALKLARQYAIEKGEPQRTRIVSRRQSYHGNTLGALSAGGNMSRRAPFEPLLMPVRHIAPCYAYRDRRNGETEHEYGMRVADELESAIEESGPETVLCFIAETVSGATLGCVPPVPGYFARIREICDQRGVLLILDEVMCGMGRTG